MRTIKTLLSLFILSFIVLACSDEEDDVMDERLSDDIPISFRLDGELVQINASANNMFLASYTEDLLFGIGNAFIYGAYNGQITNLDNYNGGEVINLRLVFQDGLETISYPVDDDVISITYLNSTLDAEYAGTSGTITITELNTAGIAEGKGIIAGTFECVLEKDDGSDDAPDRLTITDGVFRYTNVNNTLLN
jgi:hypothetical protein